MHAELRVMTCDLTEIPLWQNSLSLSLSDLSSSLHTRHTHTRSEMNTGPALPSLMDCLVLPFNVLFHMTSLCQVWNSLFQEKDFSV